MSSQTAKGWHPNPQLMQHTPPQAPQQAPPAGWTGSWPPGSNVAFPPGYPGPPPMPAGAGAHPGWNAGFWQYNPQANMQNAQQPWAPGMGWAFPANYNPYKRIPRPASPSYWQTKLSDNGLGLEGMVKRWGLRGAFRREPEERDGDTPQTPWIWSPPSLLESGDRATPTRDFNPRRTGSLDSSTRSMSTPTRDYGGTSRRPSQDDQSAHAYSQTRERGTPVRPDYLYPSRGSSQDSHHHATSGPTIGHSSDPYDARYGQTGAGSAGPSAAHQHSSLRRSDTWDGRARSQPPAPINVPPYPAPTPTPTSGPTYHTRSAPAQQPVFTAEPESFTSKADLQPTFSANIIRTPTYYQQSRRSTDDPPPSSHSRSPSSRGPSSTPSRGPPAPEPLGRQSSLPNAASSSRDIYSGFTEDLSTSLSSFSSRTRSSGSTAPLTRSRTEPALDLDLATIPEASSALSSGEQFFAPLPHPPSSDESSPEPSPRPRDRRSPYASRPSPEPSPRYRDSRPSPYASRPSPDPSPRSRDQRPSPYPSSNRRDNPLPPPPVERPNLEMSRPPVQEPPPATYSRKVRMGLWNRRGDHLTPNSYIVYAPQDRAYPAELRDYPDETRGYKDQFDTFVPFRERPELPASLPYHGRPPAQPYDTFLVYTYLP
ncbi:hypothetical protein HYDPIDRAFT_168216 [Hydnomerulius pinastri MD-312]|uniref:Uncharacterized protein n=1 Tax=Hydnomerulius pinastri MD-312 TaxID=994086 RepID=A0A0C9WE99_9AGAM|nr:hypothetical protein HYDPIDRAFT_168216 [Hydnomerulius pinastri MD-312]